MRHQAPSTLRNLIIAFLLAIAIFLPRVLSLDSFVNIDERKWLARSGNFYYALVQGDFENTFQREHPGVTIMWAGTAGFLWRYPAYVHEVPGYLGWEEEEIESFLRLHGYEPLELLMAARFFVVAMTTITLVTAFVMAIRLFGHNHKKGNRDKKGNREGLPLQKANHKEGNRDKKGNREGLPLQKANRNQGSHKKGNREGVPRKKGNRNEGSHKEGNREGLPLQERDKGRDKKGNREGLPLQVWVGFVLIAFDPFHVALSRMLHLDGLVASFMLLCIMAFLNYCYGTQRRVDLLLSGIAGGLAWLTKSPSFFLIPFVGLLLLAPIAYEWYRQRRVSLADLWRVMRVLLAWGLVGLATYVLLWPAMWVDPIGTLGRVVGQAFSYASEGHHDRIFFNGKIIEGDAGFLFYPITYLWRSTPVVLFGLLFALVAFFRQWTPLDRRETRQPMVALLLFALLFTLFMGVGSKKFDRYLIPIYFPLDLVAALGWTALAYLLKRGPHPPAPSPTGRGGERPFFPLALWERGVGGVRAGVTHMAIAALLLGACVVQAFGTLTLFPHFMTFYNPLLGGSAKAPQTMMIGWGEGLDEAGRYLNGKPNADQLRVASWYALGPFSYFFKGQSDWQEFEEIEDIPRWLDTDYAVLYVHQWQRERPTASFLDYFSRQTPEHVINMNGIEYAQIYNLREGEPPDFLTGRPPRFTDWNEAIRLLDYQTPTTLALGEPFQTIFYLQNIAPLERDMSVLVRIVHADGNELLRDEGWPFGSPTSQWELHDIWRDGHTFIIPEDAPAGYYHIKLSFYDPATFDSLPVTDAWTGEALGEARVVDYLFIGDYPDPPTPISPKVLSRLGSHIELMGAEVRSTNHISLGQPQGIAPTLSPGATFHLGLFWQTKATINQDYTVFMHLIGPDGQLITQQDQPPLAGFLPTSLWRPNEHIADQATLTLPPDAPTGTYEVRVGMYDPATGQRLPVTRQASVANNDASRSSVRTPAGDYVVVGTISVEQ